MWAVNSKPAASTCVVLSNLSDYGSAPYYNYTALNSIVLTYIHLGQDDLLTAIWRRIVTISVKLNILE